MAARAPLRPSGIANASIWRTAAGSSSSSVRAVITSRQQKHYSSAARKLPDPVDLAFDVIEPKEVTVPDQSFVICHGLFGSKQNWRSLGKAFAQKLGMTVYTLDMRNHGISPSAAPHTYDAMAADIAHFVEKQGIKNMNLLGHSMGGKAVMAYALNSDLNGPLRTLTSVDMTPAVGKVSPDFQAYTDAMLDIEKAKVHNRHEADKILEKVEPSKPIRQFLLTNMVSESDSLTGKSHMRFRLPVQLLKDSIESIGEFPYTPPPPVSPMSPQWMGPTLFLKGAHSKYINRRNTPICEAFFPNARFVNLDTGHWVHSEKPKETVDAVAELVQNMK